MRLKRLYFGDFRVLRDLAVYFEPPTEEEGPLSHQSNYALDFLVGVNGTGKSTILRALSEIFRRIDGDTRTSSFPFEITYRLASGEEISVANFDLDTGEITQDFQLRHDGGEERVGKVDDRYLPSRIVAFTSGSETEWETLKGTDDLSPVAIDFMQDTEIEDGFVQEVPGLPVRVEELDDSLTNKQSRFLFVRASQLPLVTLCGLLADLTREDRRLRKVLEEAKIGNFRGFSLKFRTNLPSADPNDLAVVSDLAKHAKRALRLGSDRLLVFDLTGQEYHLASTVLEEFGDGLSFFEILARLATPGDDGQAILREVNLFIERPEAEDPEAEDPEDDELDESPLMHLFDWLSDGERSLLGRMCLFSILGTTETLVLLDEPDVHFNDYWKQQIVQLIDRAARGGQSHILITTHSSIVLTDVPREDIVVLGRDANYTDRSSFPRMRTFASDPSDIMVHVFGAPQAAGARSVELIQQALQKPRDELGRIELEQLLEQSGPGYWSYLLRSELMKMDSE